MSAPAVSREAEAARFLRYREKYLPGQLERARLRVIHLEREAERMGLSHLLEGRRNG